MGLFDNVALKLTPAQTTHLGPFYTALSTAVLQLQLLDDLLCIAPDYPAELTARLSAALDVGSDRLSRRDALDEAEAADPESVPFERLDGSDEQRDVWEMAEIWHSIRRAGSLGAGGLERAVFAGQVVAICSALEALAKALSIGNEANIGKESGSLFGRLKTVWTLDPSRAQSSRPNDADLNSLKELIETRNLVAHNRGVVDEHYWKRASWTAQLPGDDVTLDRVRLHSWLRLADELGTYMVIVAT